MNRKLVTYLDILAIFVRYHDFNNKMFGMRSNRLLADMFYKLCEFHRQAFLTLRWCISIDMGTVDRFITFFFPMKELHNILTP